MADGLWAGAGEVDITPALGTPLAGLFDLRHADRIERRLHAKALALSCDGVTVLLISCDLIMMRACDIVDEAKQRITARTGLPPSQVMVSATHTHSGPGTVPNHGTHRVDPDYIERVIEAIAQAATDAITTQIPARIGYGQAPASGVAFNRRYRRTDGQVQTNPGRGRSDLAGPAGPVDPTVTGLVVESRDGRPLATWANMSLHYVATEPPGAISSDYFGATGEALQRLLGTPIHAQLTNACSGDINNVDLDEAVPDSGLARIELVATAVAGAVAAGTMMAPRHTEVALASTLLSVPLDRVQVTEEDREIAAAVVAGERDDAPFSFFTGLPIPAPLRERYAQRIEQIHELPPRRSVPVMVMTIGDLCLVGLPGEIFVELGLAIRAGSRYPVTAVVGLANDHIGYVPTARAWSEGGFETWRTAVSWTAPGAGERLVEAALEVMGLPGGR